jgi:hypothetical protein
MELSDQTRERLVQLFARVPLLPIWTEDQLHEAQAMMDQLVGRPRDEA